MDIWRSIQNQYIDVKCPTCSIHKRVLLKDVILNKTVICPACESKVKLIDKDSSGRKSRQQVISIEDQINNLFRNL